MTYPTRRPAPAPSPRSGVRRWLGALGEIRTRRTRREVAYLAVTGVLGGMGLVFVAVLAVVGPVLALTVIGLPLVGVGLVAARRAGSLQREVVARIFHRDVPAPARADRGTGLRAWTRSALTDRAGWRAIAYLVVHVPVVVTALLVGVAGVVAAALVLDPLWRLVHPPGWVGGSWTRSLLLALAGVVGLVALPWIVRLVVRIDLRLVRSLLGATERDVRIERSRARAVNRAAAELRRLEEDPGVGPAEEAVAPVVLDLRAGVRPAAVREDREERPNPGEGDGSDPRLDLTTVDRRQRDRGLGQALACLAAEVPTPTRLHLDLNGTHLPVAVEALAEVAAAELMQNVVRHSGAGLAELSAVAGHGSLTLRVSDDGRGGVATGVGTGLDRLSELLAPVRGHLVISSPPGGPTDITVALPLAPAEAPHSGPAAGARTDGGPPRVVLTEVPPLRPLDGGAPRSDRRPVP